MKRKNLTIGQWMGIWAGCIICHGGSYDGRERRYWRRRISDIERTLKSKGVNLGL